MNKFSQPMAPESSSDTGSGVPEQLASEVIPAGDAVTRGGDEPPRPSLLDKHGRVESISFVIPQTPRGKSRHQTVVTLRCGQCQRMIMGQRKECPHCMNTKLYFSHSSEYTPADQRAYEQFAGMCAVQGMRGREKFSGPTEMRCVFWFGIPKSRAKKLKDGDWHTQRPDTDNCIKSTDAFLSICFADDCIISKVSGEKRWTSGAPRTEVFISSLEVPNGLHS